MSKLSDLTPEQRLDLGEKLREMPEDDKREFIAGLTGEQQREIFYDPIINLRREQYIPVDHDKNIHVICAGRGWGKLLSKDTEILTTNGWTNIGEINIGDKVFDEMGDPCNVLDYFEPNSERNYEIEFDTGEKVIACEDHLWTTFTARDRKAISRHTDIREYPDNWYNYEVNTRSAKYLPTVKTTKEIIETFYHGKRNDLNHSIPLTKNLNWDSKDTLIHPYVLGYWIGDGSVASNAFTGIDQESWDRFRELGYEVKDDYKDPMRVTIKGLQSLLRQDGTFHKKNIPSNYILNSFDNRLELLKGLMDSDGYIDRENGVVEFCQKDKEIALVVHELACSFGEKPNMYTGRALLKGVDHGEKYRVMWKVGKINPFHLKRKASIANEYLAKNTAQKLRTNQRMMKSFREVPTPDCGMRCLSVDSPSNLFLITRSLIPTHNTHCIARMYKHAVEYRGVKNIAIAAPSANDLVNTILRGVSGILEAYDDDEANKPIYSPHYGTLTHPNGTIARLVSSESPDRSRGINSELLICDEISSWSGDALAFFHNLQYGLRLGDSQAILVTTPKATPLMIELFEKSKDPNGNVKITTGSTFDNAANLSKAMLDNAEKTRHTKMGKAEVEGELILVNDEACWSPHLLDECRTSAIGEFSPNFWQKVVISVDPAGSSTKDGDETGIVVGALTESNKVIILKDETARMSADTAVQKIHTLYDYYEQFSTVKIRTEKNGLGYFFKELITKDRPFLQVEEYMSVKKKFARALHAASFYETGIVFHDKAANLTNLEQEQITWGSSTKTSPNRIDALGGAIEGLVNTGHFVKRKKFIL